MPGAHLRASEVSSVETNSRAQNPSDDAVPSGDDFISLQTASAQTELSIPTLRRMIRRGDLRAYRYGPRIIRVRRAELLGCFTAVQPGRLSDG